MFLRLATVHPNAYSRGSLSYIIDFESVRQLDDGATPKHFIPETDFYACGIAGPEINTSDYGLDPMVPYDGQYIAVLC